MSGTLALASALAEMDRSTLLALLRVRRPQAPASITDPIGLAAELLRPESIAKVIAHLDRSDLALLLSPALATAAQGDRVSRLTGLGLLGRGGQDTSAGPEDAVALPEVVEVLTEALDRAGHTAEQLSADPDDVAEVEDDQRTKSPADTSSWFTTALTAVGQTAESLRVLAETPARLNRNGTLAVASIRATAERAALQPEQVALALELCAHAGFTLPLTDAGVLVITDTGLAWAELDHVDRWLALAAALGQSLGPQLRELFEAETLINDLSQPDLAAIAARVPERFPLLPEAEVTGISETLRAAEYLGVTVSGVMPPAAALLWKGDAQHAAAAATAAMPPATAGVYVQPDLSVVIPGPLTPADEAAIAALTQPEHIGIASTRRVTNTAITTAFERGMTAASAREVFARLTLTGLPQPLDYLLDALAERVGSIVVAEHTGNDARASVTVSRLDLADTLLVDRALQHLQLHRTQATSTVLFSRLRAEHVTAALTEARYHVTPGVSGATAAIPGRAGTTAGDAIVTPTGAPESAESLRSGDHNELPETLLALADRVLTAAASSASGTGDFTRKLELAIRERILVSVTAESRGQSQSFTLLPVSVSNGRLRASDPAAGVERTLPVHLITAVEVTAG